MNAVIKRGLPSARLRFGVVLLIVVAAIGLVGPGMALAATSTTSHGTSAASDQYDKPAKGVKGTTGTSSGGGGSYTPPAATSSSGGTLPFTGMSLIWPALAAVALVGLGVGLRRHDRKS
jgi:hypothetical protein